MRTSGTNIKEKIVYFLHTFITTKSSVVESATALYYQNALLSYQNKDNLINMDQSLNNIKQLQNKNTEIIFIKIPYFSQVTNENCNSKDEGELKIINNLNKYDFSLIDFKPIFCSIENREKLFLRLDTSHLSEYGHEIVAVNLKSYFNK